jgi:hypothetical protein
MAFSPETYVSPPLSSTSTFCELPPTPGKLSQIFCSKSSSQSPPRFVTVESPVDIAVCSDSPEPEGGIDGTCYTPSLPTPPPPSMPLFERVFRYLARPVSPEHELNQAKLGNYVDDCRRTHEQADPRQRGMWLTRAQRPYPSLVHGHLLQPGYLVQPDPDSILIAEKISHPTTRYLNHGIRAIEVDLCPGLHVNDDDAVEDRAQDPPHLLEFRREWFRWLRGDESLPQSIQPKPSLRAVYDAMWTNWVLDRMSPSDPMFGVPQAPPPAPPPRLL